MIIEEKEKKCNRWPNSSRCMKKIKTGTCPALENVEKNNNICKGGVLNKKVVF